MTSAVITVLREGNLKRIMITKEYPRPNELSARPEEQFHFMGTDEEVETLLGTYREQDMEYIELARQSVSQHAQAATFGEAEISGRFRNNPSSMKEATYIATRKAEEFLFGLVRDGKKYVVQVEWREHTNDIPMGYTASQLAGAPNELMLFTNITVGYYGYISEISYLDHVIPRPTLRPIHAWQTMTTWAGILKATKRLLLEDFKLMCAGESLRKYTNIW